jgi:hypothetical protein
VLAGRPAVSDVVRSQQGTQEPWVPMVPTPDRGVALWCHEHERPLGLGPQRVVERQLEIDRPRDRGSDLGR